MGFMYVLLALTTVAAYTQASVAYGSQRTRLAPRQDYGRRDYNPLRQDTYGGGSRRDGLFTRTDNSHLIGGRPRGGGSYAADARRDSSYGRQDSSYGRQDSSYGGGARRADRRPAGTYNAGRLVQDLVYNPRRAGGKPGYDSGRQVDGYGTGGRRSQRNCNCLPSEVCVRDQRGRPLSCRPAANGYVSGNSRLGARSGCFNDVHNTIFNKCNARQGITMYIFLVGSCQIFTTSARDPYCQPNGDNNIFRTKSECIKYCRL